jgi:UDP-N-acetylmuramate--alanine ligase
LQDRIDGAEIISEENTSVLNEYDNSVIIFMGAGDIQKFQESYEKQLTK